MYVRVPEWLNGTDCKPVDSWVRIPPCTPVYSSIVKWYNNRLITGHSTFNSWWRNHFVGALCNGSTTDFDSVSLGSIPNAPAKFKDTNSNFYNFFGIKEKCILFNYAHVVYLVRTLDFQSGKAGSNPVASTNMP